MRRALLLVVLAGGCGKADGSAPAAAVEVIGGPGSSDGRFATPRGGAWDPRGFLYVVDKTGRIQKFDASGKFVLGWMPPAVELGHPTNLAIDSGGEVLVADTHYHRILRYSPDGRLLARFGGPGKGPGEFLYPVGIAVAPDGTIYVSEYGGNDAGGNDRIQVFTAEGKLLRGWGSYGEAPGEFRRPQGIALRGDRLYVADTVNHRVQVFTTEGKLLAVWGDLKYPYSVSVDGGGNVLVAEYGRQCVTRFRPDGTRTGSAGKVGSRPGELATPWGVVAMGERVAVLDSGNHRVQLWPSKMLEAP
jgi:DNA-binding beta-propeller fold protein YncE